MIRAYIKQLQQVYNGPVWYGESYLEKLRNIDEKIAFTKPSDDIHSIAELISHAIYWRGSLINVLNGNPYTHTEEDPGNWVANDDLKLKGWETLKSELEKTQQQLLSQLGNLSDDDLQREFRKNSPLEYLVSGVIQHDIYHLGQIGLVKRMVI